MSMSDDLALKVRQIGNFPIMDSALFDDLVLLQRAGSGGPYFALESSELVSTALGGAAGVGIQLTSGAALECASSWTSGSPNGAVASITGSANGFAMSVPLTVSGAVAAGGITSSGVVSAVGVTASGITASGTVAAGAAGELTASGAGWDRAAAEAACVGEAIERWQARPLPDDQRLELSLHELQRRAFGPGGIRPHRRPVPRGSLVR